MAPDRAAKEDEFRAALDDWLAKKSFRGVARVSNALNYVGLNLPIKDFDKQTGLDTAERLERYTKMRHDIVHRGRRPSVVRKNVQECIDLIAKMGAAINKQAVTLYKT
jgi:hypothetical protein